MTGRVRHGRPRPVLVSEGLAGGPIAVHPRAPSGTIPGNARPRAPSPGNARQPPGAPCLPRPANVTLTQVSNPNENSADQGSDPSFAEDYTSSIRALRESLATTLEAMGVDPSRPQDIARRFQLNKNLTWKLSRLLREEDPATALRFVPGPSGLRILVDAFSPEVPEVAAGAERAAEQFADMQAKHAGDRATLEMMIAGLAYHRVEPEAIEQARRQAFLGNASIWGVQARSQYSTYVVGPHAGDADWADVVLAAGLVDFRRTRPDARWILGRRQAYGEHGELVEKRSGQPLTPPPHGPEGAPLLPDFCSSPLPDVEVVRRGPELCFELPGGTVGNSSLTTVTYAERDQRAGPRVQDAAGHSASFVMNLRTPTEHAQFDLLLHRDLGWEKEPEFLLFGRLHGGPSLDPDSQADLRLPTQEKVQRVPPTASSLTSDRLPDYHELLLQLATAGGWKLEDFQIWRVSLGHPPIPTAAAFSVELPSRG